MVAFLTWLIGLIVSIFAKIKDETGPILTKVWEVASNLGSSFCDWLTDDNVDVGRKTAALLGVGYVVAPGVTSSVVESVGEGIADVADTTVSTVDSVFNSLTSSTWFWVALGGFGLYLALKE